MKRFVSHTLVFLALGCTFTALSAAQQSLGDAAREARKNKPPEPTTKVVTNDDFGRPWVSLNSQGTPSNAAKPEDDAKKSVAEKNKDKKTSAEQQAELDKQWLARKLKMYGLKAPNGIDKIQKIVAGRQLWNYDNLEPTEKKLIL